MNAHARRSKIALGLCVICVLFLVETAVAHRTTPSPHSPLIWTVLGAVAVLCAGVAAWSHHKSKAA